ncbi:hypothetical protein ELS19_19745 [Halogeometricum borinquense]|uniref:Peptidase M50 domain-containing protein n=1 Tax=Halogeometricum borinquense TaxID=60847 RepID=A0A482T599_9EURY|nr:hypothetical protein [Halogeometricum borinquense]RYJ08027.1 hypothetical protein ELS19_19745 [Halogeometricum borinquense]
MAAGFEILLIFSGVVAGQFLLLIVHEFGHVIPVLATGGTAHITIGGHDGRTVKIGPVEVTVGFESVQSVFTYGTVEWRGVESDWIHAVAILSGPLMSLVVVLIFGVTVLRGIEPPIYWILANLALLETVRLYQTLIPKTYSRGPYEGRPSDGKRFLQLVRS